MILSFAKMNLNSVFLKTSKELTTLLPTMSKFVQILIPSHIRKLFLVLLPLDILACNKKKKTIEKFLKYIFVAIVVSTVLLFAHTRTYTCG